MSSSRDDAREPVDPDDPDAPAPTGRASRWRFWRERHRWVGMALLLLCTGLAPAPPQLPPRPPDEFQQVDDEPLSSLPPWDSIDTDHGRS